MGVIPTVMELAGLATATGTLLVLMIKGARKLAASIREPLNEINAKITNLETSVESIRKEVHFNASTSMKDMVHRIEERVGRNTAIWSAAIEQSDEPKWESDEEGSCIKANRALCELMGHSERSILANNWRTCIAPADQERVITAWDRCVHESRDFDQVFRYMREDGTLTDQVRVRATALVARNDHGAHAV